MVSLKEEISFIERPVAGSSRSRSLVLGVIARAISSCFFWTKVRVWTCWFLR